MSTFTWPNIDFSEEFKPLGNAPITEAVIYWQAQPNTTLQQLSLPSLLLERLPGYTVSQPLFVQSIEASSAVDGTSRFSQETQWIGFKLEDPLNHYVAQFNQTGVVFSRLAPYDRWKSFLAEAMRFWHTFVDLTKPSSVQRLGVRYINRIPLTGGERPSTYLTSLPGDPSGLTTGPESFFYQDVYKVPGHPYSINWVRTVQPPASAQDDIALILDIDVSTASTIEVIHLEQENLIKKLNEMRWFKNKTFFGCITQTALERFS
jgi:uncharacterized protein (TIGR04255 family)